MTKKTISLILLAIVFAIFLGYRFIKKEIVDHSQLIIGTNIEYPPFSFKKDDTVTGFDIDVVKEVARRMDKKPILKVMTFDALIPETQLGHVELVAAGMTPTAERAKRVIFTKPHFEGTPIAIVTLRDKPAYTSLDQLKGKKVAVNQGFFTDPFVSAVPDIDVIRVGGGTVSEGILALQSDRADAYVTSIASLSPLKATEKMDNYTVNPIEGPMEKVALMISKKYAYLEKPIQEALDSMVADGTIDALQAKWKLK